MNGFNWKCLLGHLWTPWRDFGIPPGHEGDDATVRNCERCGVIDNSRSDWVGQRP